MSAQVYIVGGPNGVGKTTFAREFLPRYADCKNFINADLIAQGVAPFSPEAAAFRAGRLMLEEIEIHATRKADFGFETTLSGRSYQGLIRRLKARGYRVQFFFLTVPSVDLALARVKSRFASGGHSITESVVRRRFHRSIHNFFLYYRSLADSWTLFDNSNRKPEIIALMEHSVESILDEKKYRLLLTGYGKR